MLNIETCWTWNSFPCDDLMCAVPFVWEFEAVPGEPTGLLNSGEPVGLIAFAGWNSLSTICASEALTDRPLDGERRSESWAASCAAVSGTWGPFVGESRRIQLSPDTSRWPFI